MIINSACPDDSNFKLYFSQLKQNRFNKNNFFFKNKLARELTISQYHHCPICNDDLYNGESLHKHHIIDFKDGGKTTFSNLVLLHQPCHSKITFMKSKKKQKRYQLFLLEYKSSHPSLLARYLREQKKHGITSDQITENFISELESNQMEDIET